MNTIALHALLSHTAQALERVARGETLTVTLDDRPVAELGPVPSRPLGAEALLARWRGLPTIDAGGVAERHRRFSGLVAVTSPASCPGSPEEVRPLDWSP